MMQIEAGNSASALGRAKNREHAKRTRQRKKALLSGMEDRLEGLKKEADDLQQLLIRSKTASILLGFANPNQSESAKMTIKISEGPGKVSDGEHSTDSSCGSDSVGMDSDGGGANQSGNECQWNEESCTESNQGSKKRKVSAAGLTRSPSTRTLKKLGIPRSTSSISISELSSAQATDNDEKHFDEGGTTDHERGGSPTSRGFDSGAYSGSTFPGTNKDNSNPSIIDKLRWHVRSEIRQSQHDSSYDEVEEPGYEPDGSTTSILVAEVADMVKRERSASVIVSECLDSHEDMSDGEKSQFLKKERNRIHAKLTRDRKKLFTTKMSEIIAYLEQENEKRRQKLVELGVLAPDGTLLE